MNKINNKSVDALVKSALLSLAVPVERLRFSGTAKTFVVFQLIFRRETSFSDDNGEAYEYLYRADIYSKSDYTVLLRQAEQKLKEAGFYGFEVNAEMYENDTGFYHVPIEFYYMEEM